MSDDVQHGPDDEQLGLGEDIRRLVAIGDLIYAGHAQFEDYDWGEYERAFMRGYLGMSEEP